MQSFKKLIGSKIYGGYICLWTPLESSNLNYIDIFINLSVLSKNNEVEKYEISTDADAWSPKIKLDTKVFEFENSDIQTGINNNILIDKDFDFDIDYCYKYYDIEKDFLFSNLIGKTIIDVYFLNIGSKEFEPYGVKIILSDGNELISVCSTNGTIIGYNSFLKDNIENSKTTIFDKLGRTEYIPIALIN